MSYVLNICVSPKFMGFPDSSIGKDSACQCRRPWFKSWVGKICWRRDRLPIPVFLGFPGGSIGKESACNAGDPCLILGLGRLPGEGIGYLFQYSWASLVAQIVKNLPAMWETWAQTLCWEDLLGKGLVTHSSILAWRILMDRGAWWATVHGVAKNWTLLSDKAQHSSSLCFFTFLWVSFERFCQIF